MEWFQVKKRPQTTEIAFTILLTSDWARGVLTQ